MKIFRYRRFVKDLLHFMFEFCESNCEDIPVELLCRKLYKYGLIDKKENLWVEK